MQELSVRLKKELHDMRGMLATLMVLPHQIGTLIPDAAIAHATRSTAKDKIHQLRQIADRLDALVEQMPSA